MPRRKRSRSLEEIPTSSFGDLAFLLIIFFILTTTFAKSKGFVTDLPSGQKTQSANTEEVPTVTLTASEIKYKEQTLTIDELRRELEKLKLGEKQKPEDRIVILESANSVAYQSYFETMAAITLASGVVAIVKEEPGKDRGK